MIVAGLGSRSRGDDAVGLAVVEALSANPPCRLEALGDASGLVELLGEDAVVLVDAVIGTPGEVGLLDLAALQGGAATSTHGLGVPQAVELGRVLHGEIDLTVVGIGIEMPAPGVGLSEAVSEAVPRAAALVREVVGARA